MQLQQQAAAAAAAAQQQQQQQSGDGGGGGGGGGASSQQYHPSGSSSSSIPVLAGAPTGHPGLYMGQATASHMGQPPPPPQQTKYMNVPMRRPVHGVRKTGFVSCFLMRM